MIRFDSKRAQPISERYIMRRILIRIFNMGDFMTLEEDYPTPKKLYSLKDNSAI